MSASAETNEATLDQRIIIKTSDTNPLERILTISVPIAELDEAFNLCLHRLARKVKIDGFRPGKVPLHLVKKRFLNEIRDEVARDMIQSSLANAIKESDLVPVSSPNVELEQLEEGKDFKYTASFEIYPEINIIELDEATIDVIQSEVKEADVNGMLETLRQQHKEWQEVNRPVAKEDKVVVDFEGFLGEEAFEGGKATDYELTIGSGSMIPGFEDGLMGAKLNEPFEITVTFPADYNKDLAGKEARFIITVKKVMQGELPALDEEFVKRFNLKEDGLDALKEDIKKNMTRELERRVSALNREQVFKNIKSVNPVNLPLVLIDREIEELKHEMYHRIFGNHHSDNEKIPDFPRELFEERAKHRVHVGLIFAEYVKKHQLVSDKARVDAMIDKLAEAYETPAELRSWYQENKEHRAEIEALVLEEVAAEKMSSYAKCVEKVLSYDEVMNLGKETTTEGE